MGRGWFESDEDYQARTAREANEATIERLRGDAPSKGWFESDDEYASRISLEASERVIESSTGDAPHQGWFESSSDYRERVAHESQERIIADVSGREPRQGWFEADDDYKHRVRHEAHERTIEGHTGEAPSRGWFETEGDYRSRVSLEAREQRIAGFDREPSRGRSPDDHINSYRSRHPARESSSDQEWVIAVGGLVASVAGYRLGVWLADNGFERGASYTMQGLGIVGVLIVIASVVLGIWSAGFALVLAFKWLSKL